MPATIERQLDQLVNEIHNIKRDVILQKAKQDNILAGKHHQWRLLEGKCQNAVINYT